MNRSADGTWPSRDDFARLRPSRRRFLCGAAAGVVAMHRGAQAQERRVTIDRIDVFPVVYPTVGYFKFFSTPRGVAGRPAVVVKVAASDGTTGWGQSVPLSTWSYETLETAQIVLRDYFAPTLIGRDPLDIDGVHRILDGALAGSFSTGMPIARAGLDLAIHDLAGRLRGVSLAKLFGRSPRHSITLSWTVNPKSLDDAAALIETGWDRGYRHFNIKVAPHVEDDVALAQAVRRRAPDAFLWADANGGYEPDTAMKAAAKLADAGVDVLEAPLKPNRIRGYRALKKQAALPIYMDEGVVSPVELEEFIELDMLDGVAMKPSRCGGLASARRQIELLSSRGLKWLGSGLTDPDIALAASVALYAAYDLDKPAALNGPQFLDFDLLREPLKITDGRCAAPTGPGLGVDVDEDKLRELVSRSKQAK